MGGAVSYSGAVISGQLTVLDALSGVLEGLMTDLMARRLTGEATISWHDSISRDQTPITG
ncbi:hypothetical protein [Streptomyces yerevanensis]|uniref:hypothetical protein n=1 Tax=Streptomyces yerevanensis TaxID=66378 RepID=UPI000525AA0A|nr:hypothetical protein [Streptomyces yerevanensis]